MSPRYTKPAPETARRVMLADGYQLCARCGKVMPASVEAQAVPRASFWHIYSHYPGITCPAGRVKGWNEVQKFLDAREAHGLTWYAPLAAECDLHRFLRKLELVAVTISMHDLLVADHEVQDLNLCGGGEHNHARPASGEYEKPDDLGQWAKHLQEKWYGTYDDDPDQKSKKLNVEPDYPPRSWWNALEARARAGDPNLAGVLATVECDVLSRERPISLRPRATWFAVPFVGTAKDMRSLVVRTPPSKHPGDTMVKPLPSGRVLARAADGTPIEFQGTANARAVHLRSENGQPEEWALWCGRQLPNYLEERRVPPPPRLPFDHRTRPELYRRDGQIWTLDLKAAVRFMALRGWRCPKLCGGVMKTPFSYRLPIVKTVDEPRLPKRATPPRLGAQPPSRGRTEAKNIFFTRRVQN